MTVYIDRCLCFQRTFTDLQTIAHQAQASTLEELQRHVQFGEKCRLCHPYVKDMLKTGRTVFHQIMTES